MPDITLPYDGYQVARYRLNNPPTNDTPQIEVNGDGVWHNMTVLDEDGQQFGLIGIKGPGYSNIPSHAGTVEITKTCLPRIKVDGVIVDDGMIYLWDQEDNR